MSTSKYDYIIAGAGCSGLSLAWHLKKAGVSRNQKILIVDPAPEPINDRTWCFWSLDALPDPVPISKSWKLLDVCFADTSIKLKLTTLEYHCVQSDAYATSILNSIKDDDAFTVLKASVLEIHPDDKRVLVTTDAGEFEADYLFQSFGKPDLSKSKYPLLQHFGGWEIETETNTFDTKTAKLMDFSVMGDDDPATFVYVLPFTPTKALVEFTVFSDTIRSKQDYDSSLKKYISAHFPGMDYHILRKEYGVIPMADSLFNLGKHNRVIPIGTPSGIPKASTGYAFSRIHRQARDLAKQLANGDKPVLRNPSGVRYRLFDLLMLDVLHLQKSEISSVFESLFRHNPPERILRFLDEQTTPFEDLQIMASVPPTPFMKAILRNLVF